jgi:ubiquinone/menaquinone biosynthesis C-methylase UbiE
MMEAYHDPNRRARMLGSDERGKWLRSDELISEKVKAFPGMNCVDLGSGAGALSLPLAKAVGEKGKVYAVDINSDVLDVIREKNPPQNLVIIQRDAADTGLDASIADICIMVLLLHEVPPEGVLAEAYRLLKPGGRALVLEWRMDYEAPHPPHNERIDREHIERLLTEAGFSGFEYAEWTKSHYVATAVKN